MLLQVRRSSILKGSIEDIHFLIQNLESFESSTADSIAKMQADELQIQQREEDELYAPLRVSIDADMTLVHFFVSKMKINCKYFRIF